MAQTALQDAIQDLTFMAEKQKEPLLKICYVMAITICEQHLPKERKIIEDAHAAGVVDGDFSTGFTGSDYFTQNFNPSS
jgi:hypothetical protein